MIVADFIVLLQILSDIYLFIFVKDIYYQHFV